MQDELFMRGWNAGHEHFSADLDASLERLVERLTGSARSPKGIDAAYGGDATRSRLSGGAQASLRGLAASVLTVLLWASVMVLATPAPGLAASVVHLPLA